MLVIKISMNTGSERVKNCQLLSLSCPHPVGLQGVSPVNTLVCIHPEFSNEHTDICAPHKWDGSIKHSR